MRCLHVAASSDDRSVVDISRPLLRSSVSVERRVDDSLIRIWLVYPNRRTGRLRQPLHHTRGYPDTVRLRGFGGDERPGLERPGFISACGARIFCERGQNKRV